MATSSVRGCLSPATPEALGGGGGVPRKGLEGTILTYELLLGKWARFSFVVVLHILESGVLVCVESVWLRWGT